MKLLQNRSIKLILAIVLVLALVAAGFAAWQSTQDDASQSQPENTTTTAANQQPGEDCGNDRACFYEAYVNGDCSQDSIKTTKTTVEGDPIITTASLSPSFDGCVVQLTVDGTQDKFGDGKVHIYICGDLAQTSDQILTASNCTGDSEDAVVNSVAI